ncbi:MAG: hypothetical protein ACI4RP_08615 [Acutalibacteraceae bacterium]
MLEPMNALDRLSRATATSSVGRCRHLPLQGKACDYPTFANILKLTILPLSLKRANKSKYWL